MVGRSKFVFFALVCAAISAQNRPTPDVQFHVSTSLVQVDVFVTASAGHTVPSLRAEDFQLLEDGKPQQISTYSEAEHRTVVFLVDGCSNPVWEIYEPLGQFLNWLSSTAVRPGDRVSIMNAIEGSAAVQQLTDSPLLIRQQVQQVRSPTRLINWCVLGGWNAPRQIETSRSEGARIKHYGADDRIRSLPHGSETLMFQELSLAIDYLREQPGHKDLVLLGTILPLDQSRAARAVDELTSRANRAGVSLHVVVPGSLGIRRPPPVPLPTGGQLPTETEGDRLAIATEKLMRSTLTRMAQETGGLYFECPPIAIPIEAVRPGQRIPVIYGCEENPLVDTGGHVRHLEQSWRAITSEYPVYTLGYRPGPATGGFHKVAVRVLKPGLTVHARKGYYDTPEQPPAVAEQTLEPLSAVLDSPLHGSSIRLATAPFDFAEQTSAGRFRTVVRLVLLIDPRDLSWQERAGRETAAVEVSAVAHGEEHQLASSAARTCELTRPPGSGDASAQCVLEMPFDNPDLYMVRAAVRDKSTGSTGTAYAAVAASDHNAGRMTLSDPVLRGVEPGGPFSDAVFTPGARIAYELEAYGMRVDKKSGQPNLTFRVGLSSLTNGRNIFQSAETPVMADAASWRATIKGKLDLPSDLEPGDYLMEFLVTDGLDKTNKVARPNSPDRVESVRVSEFHVSAKSTVPAGH
jgi:VWFA-related protein